MHKAFTTIHKNIMNDPLNSQNPQHAQESTKITKRTSIHKMTSNSRTPTKHPRSIYKTTPYPQKCTKDSQNRRIHKKPWKSLNPHKSQTKYLEVTEITKSQHPQNVTKSQNLKHHQNPQQLHKISTRIAKITNNSRISWNSQDFWKFTKIAKSRTSQANYKNPQNHSKFTNPRKCTGIHQNHKTHNQFTENPQNHTTKKSRQFTKSQNLLKFMNSCKSRPFTKIMDLAKIRWITKRPRESTTKPQNSQTLRNHKIHQTSTKSSQDSTKSQNPRKFIIITDIHKSSQSIHNNLHIIHKQITKSQNYGNHTHSPKTHKTFTKTHKLSTSKSRKQIHKITKVTKSQGITINPQPHSQNHKITNQCT